MPRLALLLALLLAPGAHAATFSLVTADDVALHAAVAVDARQGGAILTARDLAFVGTLENVTGEARLYEWERREFPLLGDPEPPSPARRETLPLDGARLRLIVERGPFELRAAPQGGVVSLASPAPIRATGRPTALVAPFAIDGGNPEQGGPDSVPLTFEAGWPFVGRHAFRGGAHEEGFPRLPAPVLGIEGRAALHVFGGRLVITHADGRETVRELGEVAVTEAAPGTGIRTLTVRRLVLVADVGSASVPALGDALLSAPQLAWRLDGDAAWTRASGRVDDDGRSWSFEDAEVVLSWSGGMAPPAPAVALSAAYAGEGRLDRLVLDGQTVARTSVPAVPVAGPLSLVAAMVLLLTTAGQSLLAAAAASLYTRIAPARTLDHPERRRLLDLVAASPGIHQRELHRRFGTAWGAFAFHLRTLERGGHVRVVRIGGYALVYTPDTVARAASAIPQPLARAVYEALPHDGRAVDVAEVVIRVGASRDLVRYHLRALERRGLVASQEEGATLVRRRDGSA